MSANTFGKLFTLTTFGESHGSHIGGVIDGCPPNIGIDFEFINSEIQRRRTSQNNFSSHRNEADKVEFISGIFEGKTTGTPIAFLIRNTDAKSDDYAHLQNVFRPSHADFTYYKKYGIRDYRGGGRSSARETLSWVVAGAIAKLILQKYHISIFAYTSQIGSITFNTNYKIIDLKKIAESSVGCPDTAKTQEMEAFLAQVKEEKDTVGCVVNCVIQNCPAGLGEPVFDKLHADLAKAMLSINAAKGFEYGSGFGAASITGSRHNDLFNADFSTQTNHSGGIQGGISNGEDIYFRVAFKPIATLMQDQDGYDFSGNKVTIKGKGRHDICVVPRVIPVVEAMSALVLADHLLRSCQ